MGDSGEKSPRTFFRWFWDFLKEKSFSSSFLTQKFCMQKISFKCKKYH